MLLNEGVCKEVVIQNLKICPCFDIGSRVTFIREKIYRELKAPILSSARLSLIGLGQAEISPLGYFQSIIYIDDEEFPATVYVVPNSAMTLDMIIGRDVLLQANVSIAQGEVTVTKDKQPIFLTDINICDKLSLNIGGRVSEKVKNDVENLITNYTASKCKTTSVEMNIVGKREFYLSKQ